MTGNDFKALDDMIYSGRGITVGMTPRGSAFIGYSLTGRSPSSQARELLEGKNPKTGETTHTIRTSVVDDEARLRAMFNITDDSKLAELQADLKKGSPALLLYPALAHANHALFASNGAQTRLIYNALMNARGINTPEELFDNAFAEPFLEYDQKDDRWIDITAFEPDAPNNTPRISACIFGNMAALHIVRCLDGKSVPQAYPLVLEPGKGHVITTYAGGNEKPLKAFEGNPLEVLVASETPEQIAEGVYAAIYGGAKPEDNYRVASAAIMQNKETREITTSIINRIQRGS